MKQEWVGTVYFYPVTETIRLSLSFALWDALLLLLLLH